MSIQHKDAPDGERHEPKGVSTAASGEIYVANGSGSGTWTNQKASIKNANFVTLFAEFDDISTADSIFIPNPIAGTISKILVTLKNGITVANAVVTAEINGVAVTGSSITITQAGSTAGSTFTSSPTGTNTVGANGNIEIITDGASTTTAKAVVCVVMDVT